MKYLKKIFESDKVIDTNILGDILLEITDLGYLSHIENSWWSDDRSSSIVLTLYGKNQTSSIYPDEIMDAIERLIDFLDGEGYRLFGDGENILEIIKNRPTEQRNKILEIPVGRYNKVNMKWDEKINGYKLTSSFSLEFTQ
jgi:hypothetical protein